MTINRDKIKVKRRYRPALHAKSLSEVIKLLEAVIVKYGDQTLRFPINFGSTCECDHQLYIEYEDLETDIEQRDRIRREEYEERYAKEREEDHERRQYEAYLRLKAKYEGGTEHDDGSDNPDPGTVQERTEGGLS